MTTAAMPPEVGTYAPKFDLNNQEGDRVTLEGLAGKYVVLYFYPKDDTPGCTIEAQAFRDSLKAIEALNAVVLGVSPDDEQSHKRFCGKFDLNFHLLADPEHKTIEDYGVWVEKTNYGKTYMGVQRSTFLIDPKGRIAHVWPKVKPEGHAAEVVEALKRCGSA